MKKILATLTLALVACGGEDAPIPTDPALVPGVDFTCTLDSEQGSWLVSYVARDGNCGELPDQLVNLATNMVPPPPSVCTSNSNVSPDACSYQADANCAIDQFSVTQSMALRQVEPDTIEGIMDMTIVGFCSGSYRVTAQRL